MNSRRALLSNPAFVLMLTLPLPSLAQPADCTTPCPASRAVDEWQTPPCSPHATLSFEFVGQPTSGTGGPNCISTCTQCTQNANLFWNNNGQPCCLSIDLGDSGGPSDPMPKYNRPGKLFSNCDDFRTYSVILYANCDIGAAWQYTKCLTLYCGCEGG